MSAGTAGAGERGSALLVTLLTTSLIAAIAAALIVQSTTDLTLSASFRTSLEVAQAADGGLERTIAEIAALPDWSPLLLPPPANLTAPFSDGGPFRTPDGHLRALSALVAALQAGTPADYGPDSPRWRLYAWCPLARLWPGPDPPALPPVSLVVFVADDGGDGDGDPGTDSNGRVLVRVDAYGLRDARRSVEGLVERLASGVVRLTSWKAVR